MAKPLHHLIVLSDDLHNIAFSHRLFCSLQDDDLSTLYPLISVRQENEQKPLYVATWSMLTASHQAQIQSRVGMPEEWESTRQLITHLSNSDSQVMMTAIQLLRWHANHNFCSRCGASATVSDFELAYVCTVCHYRQYPRIQPCVIVAITRQFEGRTQLLLAHHRRYGDNPMYGLIAGFVEIGESLEGAVHREVEEETGLAVSNLRYHSSQPWAYPSNLMVGFYADCVNENASDELKLDDTELTDAQFFDLDNLPKIPFKGSIARTLIDELLVIKTQGV